MLGHLGGVDVVEGVKKGDVGISTTEDEDGSFLFFLSFFLLRREMLRTGSRQTRRNDESVVTLGEHRT